LASLRSAEIFRENRRGAAAVRLSPLYLVGAILGMAASIAFLVGCQSLDSSASSSAVSASWSGGRVILPRGPWRPFVYIGHNGIAIPGLRIDSGLASKLPAIVYVHASGGIRLADSQFAAQAAEWGYLVFMPDSYARAGRRPNCDGSTLQCGAFPAAFRYRNEEIRYAANRVLELPFVDHRRLFLIGDSEGGLAVANYAGDEFTGIVIGDWDCGGPPYGAIRYALPGIAAPRHVGAAFPFPPPAIARLESRNRSRSIRAPLFSCLRIADGSLSNRPTIKTTKIAKCSTECRKEQRRLRDLIENKCRCRGDAGFSSTVNF
jgi:hypothetical protein